MIADAIRQALADGIALGAPNRYEAAVAEAVCARFPSIDLVRFTNSGTEANLEWIVGEYNDASGAAVTGRAAVLVFAGAYHGGILGFAHGVSPLNPLKRYGHVYKGARRQAAIATESLLSERHADSRVGSVWDGVQER